jgi:predicted class III extradiol MEMO1 family dioxygenase
MYDCYANHGIEALVPERQFEAIRREQLISPILLLAQTQEVFTPIGADHCNVLSVHVQVLAIATSDVCYHAVWTEVLWISINGIIH